MITKRILNYERIRQIPKSFSWIDRRYVKDGHILHCTRDESHLYLFLVLVGDRFGISFYGDTAIKRILKIPQDVLVLAREGLIEKGLIEYNSPFYQVLELPQLKF